RLTPVATSVGFTLAPRTAAPDGSNTVPLMAPRKVWACPTMPINNTTIVTPSRRLISHLEVKLVCLPLRPGFRSGFDNTLGNAGSHSEAHYRRLGHRIGPVRIFETSAGGPYKPFAGSIVQLPNFLSRGAPLKRRLR